MAEDRARVAIVGGGIAGLSAALHARDLLGESASIVVVEQSRQLGGKLRTGPDGIETGAEALLTRDPDGSTGAAVRLARRVGLGGDLVFPAQRPAAVVIDGILCPLPAGTLMGVPAQLSALDGLARPVTQRDRDAGAPLLGPDQDIGVGALVRDRLGDEVVDRLVDPLLGGVYAGRADDLSLVMAVPALAAAARTAHTLTGAVRLALAGRAGTRVSEPGGEAVFTTVAGGLTRLVQALADASGASLRLGQPVRALARRGDGWQLTVGPASAPQVIAADAVVLAVPARPAARLLADVDPAAAALIGELDYASVALVTMWLPGGCRLPELSGFLVPAGTGYSVKAVTILSSKWPHLADPDGSAVLRASIGRYGDAGDLDRTDQELIRTARAEIGRLVGAALPAPSRAGVTRWGGGLPQYRPGHAERVAAARRALAGQPGLALAGAAVDGVGVASCIRSGASAAAAVIGARLEGGLPA